MARRTFPPRRNPQATPSTARTQSGFVLDSVTIESLQRDPALAAEHAKLYAAIQAALAVQRAPILSDIHGSLSRSSSPFAFSRWQRRVSIKHQGTPLSARGSIIGFVGGRFNIGSVDPSRFPPFPALYIGETSRTAHAEVLGDPKPTDPPTIEDRVFGNTESYAMYSLSGEITECFDLDDAASTADFLERTREFSIPSALLKWEQELGRKPSRVITDRNDLLETLLNPNWRFTPTLLDNISWGQVFGQLVESAGIEAIKYPSVRYPGTQCIAVFPRNFARSDSWIQLDGETPPGVITRLDATTYASLI